MIYQKRGTNWKRIAVIAILAFSLAAVWVMVKPLVIRQLFDSDEMAGMQDLSPKQRDEAAKARSDMDNLKKMGDNIDPNLPESGEIRKQMDELQKSDQQ